MAHRCLSRICHCFEVTGHRNIAGTAYGANPLGSWVSPPVSACWDAAGGGAKPLVGGPWVDRGWMESPGLTAGVALCGWFCATGVN